MIPQVLKDIAARLSSKRIVIFAGAGISMGPPSSLPNWFALNEWILKALYDRVGQAFGIEEDYSKILLDYRNSSQYYPPDYQAQFLEECAGNRYFEALTALDIEDTNRCHTAITKLAKSGRLAAIVTTNFDRLIEHALDIVDVPYAVASDTTGFASLDEAYQQKDPETLPVVKIHGSTDNLDSLVDTRKQRRRGRAEALNRVLAHLLQRFPFLYAGFSGADFVHDKRYLGIWDAAEVSPGFCYLYQPGNPPKKEVSELKEHYGPKAALFEVDAAEALEYLAGIPPLEPEADSGDEDADPAPVRIQNSIRDWADRLSPWLAARMAAALQEAASLRVNALRILKKAAQQKPEKTEDHLLLSADWVKARLRRARYDDIEMRSAIRNLVNQGHPLGFYYQFISDAFVMSQVTSADAYLKYCRQFAQEHVTLLADHPPTLAVDAVLIISQVASLYGELPELVPALRFACDRAEQNGDDVRLATTRAELAIRLAIDGKLDQAESMVHAAMAVARELQERRVATTTIYAEALIRERRGEYGKAIGSGHMAYEQAVRDELRLCMSRALLVQLRLACRYGGQENVDMAQHQINHGFEHEFWGHSLERELYEAEFAKRSQDPNAKARLAAIADRARSVGMEWIALEAKRLLA